MVPRALRGSAGNGEVRRASREEHPDLLWAVRGGGRGLGVVTSFESDLHPIGPDVAVAQLFYRYQQAERILRAWPGIVSRAPESVSPELVLWSVPRDPSLPAELHGSKIVLARRGC